MLEKNADVNCCFLCSVIFIEYYSTMHCNEVLQACQVDPIYCRYVPDIALCSFKRIWAAIEYLTPLAPKNSRKSSCPCKGRLRIGCWILFFLALVEAAESKSESAFSAVRYSLNIIQQCIAIKCCKPAKWIRYIAIYLGLPSECSDMACRLTSDIFSKECQH